MLYSANYLSPVGALTLASDGKSLIGLWIEGQKYFGSTVSGEMTEKDTLPIFENTKDWLDRYFSGKKPAIPELPLAPSGGEFRKTVWGILCEIPYGEVITYGDIAKQLASKLKKPGMSPQAAGGAAGHNPISIIIPCHRVIGANGSLTGYAGGIDKKMWLLAHEGVDVKKFTIPKRGTAL